MSPIKKIGIAAIAVMTLSLQGCLVVADGGNWDHDDEPDFRVTERENREAISGFDLGVSLASVKKQMGTPNFADRLTADGARYDILYYRTHRNEADGNTTRDECTPLVFKDGELVGSGQMALDRVPHSN